MDIGNDNYTSVDGVLFNKSITELITCPSGKSGEYSIPDSVTKVYPGAFYACANLTSVTIPNSITYIEENMFQKCSSLKNVTIPDSITSIFRFAFADCISLTSITIPSNVSLIDEWAFKNCNCLTDLTIQYGLQSIHCYAFQNCKILNVIIPDSVTSIDSHAFDSSTIITCTKGSTAEKYAKENGHSILYIDNHEHVYETTDPETATGQMKKWTKATADFLEFIIKHINDDKNTIMHFVGIMMDDLYVAPENYTVEAGSVILRWKPEYLETLSLGEHTLKAIFDDGEIEIPFEITNKPVDPTNFDDVAVPSDAFTFKKVWQGDNEKSIDFTLYKADGSVYHHGFDKRVVSKTEWRYNAYFSAPAACYVIEKPIPGYQIKYVNVGVYASVNDRCCDGGTIINKKIPKTGDTSNLALWAGMILTGTAGLTVLALTKKHSKTEK